MMRVKFKRPDTDSYMWVEMASPSNFCGANHVSILNWFHLENQFAGRGPGDDWYPVEYEESEQ